MNRVRLYNTVVVTILFILTHSSLFDSSSADSFLRRSDYTATSTSAWNHPR